ncbi:hypothetical protein LIA77_03005 [Sarocladium implicatum]|nr:hypothetical protein LIA77_03005 [Sarocladium implicatum]
MSPSENKSSPSLAVQSPGVRAVAAARHAPLCFQLLLRLHEGVQTAPPPLPERRHSRPEQRPEIPSSETELEGNRKLSHPMKAVAETAQSTLGDRLGCSTDHKCLVAVASLAQNTRVACKYLAQRRWDRSCPRGFDTNVASRWPKRCSLPLSLV